MKKYSLIELYTLDKKVFNCAVTYDDGSIEYFSELDEIRKRIEEFAKQEHLTIDEIMNDSSKIKERKIVDRVESVETSIVPVEPENKNPKEENSVVKKEGMSLKKKIIAVTSLGAALTIAFFAGKGTNLNQEGSARHKSISFNNEDTINDDTIATISQDNIPVISGNKLYNLVSRINDGERLSDEDMEYVMNEINRQVYLDVEEVKSLLNGKRVSINNEEVNLYELFPNESFDHLMVLHYNSMRNSIVNGAREESSSKEKEMVNNYLNDIIDFTFNGKVIKYDGHSYNFYSLSPLARYVVVDFGMNWLMTNPNYVGEINGKGVDFNALVNEYAETFNTTTSNLVNSPSMRK